MWNASNRRSSAFRRVHVSEPYNSTEMTKASYKAVSSSVNSILSASRRWPVCRKYLKLDRWLIWRALCTICFALKGPPKWGFVMILGVGAKVFGGKVHSSSKLCVFRHLWFRSDTPCSNIMCGYSHCHRRKFGQVWVSLALLPEVAGNLRSRRTFDYHMENIGIILRCNSWAVGWTPESTF